MMPTRELSDLEADFPIGSDVIITVTDATGEWTQGGRIAGYGLDYQTEWLFVWPDGSDHVLVFGEHPTAIAPIDALTVMD